MSAIVFAALHKWWKLLCFVTVHLSGIVTCILRVNFLLAMQSKFLFAKSPFVAYGVACGAIFTLRSLQWEYCYGRLGSPPPIVPHLYGEHVRQRLREEAPNPHWRSMLKHKVLISKNGSNTLPISPADMALGRERSIPFFSQDL